MSINVYSLHAFIPSQFHSVQQNTYPYIAKYLHCRLEVACPLFSLFLLASMALNIRFLAFILLAVSIRTILQVELLTSFHHLPFAIFGCPFSAEVKKA